MLAATLLALSSAVLHAGWNLIAKRSIDPFLALWGQFAAAGVVSAVVLAALSAADALPVAAWGWASLTGVLHIPYVLALAWAYRHGDFGVAYPVARGGGALLAAIGGIVLLGDDVGPVTMAAIVAVVAGLGLLAVGAARPQVAAGLVVAASIGCYTVVDSHASRTFDGVGYVFATFVCTGLAVTGVGLARRRGADLVAIPAAARRRTALAAVMSVVTYGLVLLAVRRAPVGYVAALRESSVLLAAIVGWRVLGEGRGPTRLAAAGVIVAGLVLLVASA